MKAYIVHGWGGSPKEGWLSWLKKELEKKGFEVKSLAMPDTNEPKIKEWLDHLSKIAKPDENTVMMGHSMGCQTILRYLEKLPQDVKIRAAIFVAGFVNLTDETFEDEEDRKIAKPWLETPIDFEKVKKHCDNFITIFSDNDPYVPLSDSKIFKDKLDAKIIVEKNKGHFTEEDEIFGLPIVLKEILKFKNNKTMY